MRVASMLPSIQYGIEQSDDRLNRALTQLTTNRRVNELADDPAASAAMVVSLSASAANDRYTANIDAVTGRMQSADSALASVVTSLNQAITLGTSGTDITLTSGNRQALAQQVQGLLESVVAQANTTYQGTYLFAGTNTTVKPFTQSNGAYVYSGNSDINRVEIGQSQTVAMNVPGDQVFTQGANVLGSLQQLVTALQSGTSAEISAATTAVSSALTYVGEQRVPLENGISRLTAQETYLSQESVTLSTQQTNLVGIDIAVAATNLSQAELTQNAVLAAAAKSFGNTLLDYLK